MILLFSSSVYLWYQGEEIFFGEVLRYELSPFPPALFEARNILRKAANLNLLRQFDILLQTYQVSRWWTLFLKQIVTCLMMVPCYADFTVRHYGQATVVFDGFGEGPSIKDNTHQRRGESMHPIVRFTTETEFFKAKRRTFCVVSKTKQTWLHSSAQH